MANDQALKDYVRAQIYNRISVCLNNQKGAFTSLSKQIGRNSSYISNIKNGNILPPRELIFRISVLLNIDYKQLIKGVEDYYYFFDYQPDNMFAKRTVKHKSLCLESILGKIKREVFLETLLYDYYRGPYIEEGLSEELHEALSSASNNYDIQDSLSMEEMINTLQSVYFSESYSAFKKSEWYMNLNNQPHTPKASSEIISIVGPIDIKSSYGYQTNIIDKGINYFVSPGLYYFDDESISYIRNADEGRKIGKIIGKVKSISVECD